MFFRDGMLDPSSQHIELFTQLKPTLERVEARRVLTETSVDTHYHPNQFIQYRIKGSNKQHQFRRFINHHSTFSTVH